jgi:hypothetical protein
VLQPEDIGILAPTKNSVLSEASQRIVLFADPDKEQYPKRDILQSKSVNLAHNFQEIKTSLCVVYKKRRNDQQLLCKSFCDCFDKMNCEKMP